MNPTGSTDLVEIEMTEPIESKTAPQSVEIEIRDSLVEEVELNPIEEKKISKSSHRSKDTGPTTKIFRSN